jgi:hypothetical protein
MRPWLATSVLLVLCLGPAETGRAGEKQEEDRPARFPVQLGGKTGYIDRAGKLAVEPRFAYADRFSEGLALAEREGKFGFIDAKGDFVIPPVYDRAWPFSEGLAAVKIAGRFGFLDRSGKIAVKAEFSAVRDFSEGLAGVRVGGKWGFVDAQGRVVIQPLFEGLDGFEGPLAAVGLEGKKGYVDKKGKFVWFDSRRVGQRSLKPEEAAILYPAEQGGWHLYIDQTGAVVIAGGFQFARLFAEGLAAVSRNNKWGFIAPSGETAIAMEFDFADSFSEGLARVKKDYKFGFIDKAGKFAIPPVYAFATSFENGLAFASSDEEKGYIDRTGKFVWRQSEASRAWCKVTTAERWRVVQAETEATLKNGEEANRLDAVQRLGDADYIEAVKRLAGLLKESNAQLAPLEDRAAELYRKIREIVGERKAGEPQVPAGRAEEVAELEKQAGEAREKQFAAEKYLGAIVAALGKSRDATCVAWLAEVPVREPGWRDRKGVAEALGSVPESGKAVEALVGLCADPEADVRVAAVDGLGGRRDERAFEAISRALADGYWRVRAAAVSAVGKSGDPVKICDTLIPRLEKEEGRLRGDIDQALEKATGRTFGADFELWSCWWSANREKIRAGGVPAPQEPPAGGGEGRAKTIAFYGLQTFSTRIIFVIDISSSMGPPVTLSGRTRELGPGEETRIAVAKRELKRAIGALPEDGTFDVVCFRRDVLVLHPCMVQASRANKEDAYRWIEALKTDDGTDIFKALGHAFHLVERPAVAGAEEPPADTIFLLSDGHGPDPEATLATVRSWNRWRRMTLHAIGIGKSNVVFLKTLAADSGGRFTQK